MYRLAYDIPFSKLVLLLVVFFCVWCFAKERFQVPKKQIWKRLHLILLIICVALFLCVSLLNRVSVSCQPWPPVFWSYKLAFMEGSYDHFQEIYLNVLAFLFISLFALELFRSRKGKIAALFACVLLSVSVESMQYLFSVGLAETDDIISNMLGVILGALLNIYGFQLYHVSVQRIKRWINKKN